MQTDGRSKLLFCVTLTICYNYLLVSPSRANTMKGEEIHPNPKIFHKPEVLSYKPFFTS